MRKKKKPMSKCVETIQIFQSKEKRPWVNPVKLPVTYFNTQMSQAALTNKCFSFFSGSWGKSLALLSFYFCLLSPSVIKDTHPPTIHDTKSRHPREPRFLFRMPYCPNHTQTLSEFEVYSLSLLKGKTLKV